MAIEIKINYALCIKCKECVKACSYGVLEWLDDMPIVVNPHDCALFRMRKEMPHKRHNT